MKSIYAFTFFVSIISGIFPVSSYAQDALDFKFKTIPRLSQNFSFWESNFSFREKNELLTVFSKAFPVEPQVRTNRVLEKILPYRIFFAAGTGVLLGQVKEFVYRDSGGDDYLSTLLWDLKPMVYLGSALSFSRTDPLAGLGVEANLSVKFGLPLLSGSIEDRDWMNNPDELTHYSKHDAYLQGGAAFPLLLDFSGGITIPIASRFAIKALSSFSFMRFSWEARDGYTKYPPDSPPTAFSGTGITYDQHWFIFSPGFGVFWPFHRSLSMGFSLFISPLIYVKALDTHVRTNVQYFDKMRWGLYVEPSLELTFSPNSYLSLVLHGNWRSIGGRGDTTAINKETDNLTKFANTAGARYSAFDLGLFLKVTLPRLPG
jgi:outer membrane protease